MASGSAENEEQGRKDDARIASLRLVNSQTRESGFSNRLAGRQMSPSFGVALPSVSPSLVGRKRRLSKEAQPERSVSPTVAKKALPGAKRASAKENVAEKTSRIQALSVGKETSPEEAPHDAEETSRKVTLPVVGAKKISPKEVLRRSPTNTTAVPALHRVIGGSGSGSTAPVKPLAPTIFLADIWWWYGGV
jgi:hypothetical protein